MREFARALEQGGVTVAITIHCEWDEEAGVWFVAESNVPGLAAEAPTVEAMQAVLAERVPELLQANAAIAARDSAAQ